MARPAPLSLVRGVSSTGARALVSGGAHAAGVKAAFTRPQAGPLLGGGRGRQEPQQRWSWVHGLGWGRIVYAVHVVGKRGSRQL